MFCFEWWDMLVGGREGNKHFKSSNSGLNSFSISQSLSLSPSLCTFNPSLLSHQNKAHFVHSQCQGSTLAPFGSYFRSCFLPTGPAWPWLSALLFEAPWECLPDWLLRVCSLLLALGRLCYLSSVTRTQTLAVADPLMVGNSWFGHLVWAFCLLIISPAFAPSNLVLSLEPVSLFLKSQSPGFGPMFNT